jgi:hypothetical protein
MWCPQEVKAPDVRPVSSLPGGSTGVEHAAWTRASWLAFFVVQIIEKMGSKVHYIIKKGTPTHTNVLYRVPQPKHFNHQCKEIN